MKKLLALSLSLFLAGCFSNSKGYKHISQKEAYEIMQKEDVIIVDVRTPEEFKEGYIKDAINLPLDQLSTLALNKLDKNDKILVYCRSGNRSRQAANILVDLGYTNVYDFGGITSWQYDIVK
ncbi:MAG: rhodanese-like domain-containing protein [Erysipelotrichaceae bacterium]|nr:rhodanese-like domain-containing protein [Erysipelotrichaceae bacterium]